MVIAEVETGSSSDDEEVVVNPQPNWVEYELSDYQEVGYPLPPPPPTTPPIPTPHSPTTSDLKTIADLLKLELYTYDHASKKFVLVPQVQMPPPVVINETKEEKVNDSLLSSVHYASSSENDYTLNTNDLFSSSSSDDDEISYHAVTIRGREGYVPVFRSKRAPQHKLYYYTRSGKKAYIKTTHLASLKRVEYYQLDVEGVPAQLMYSSTAGCLHNGNLVMGCWCEHLGFYL